MTARFRAVIQLKNLKASEVANCRCTLEVRRADGAGNRPSSASDVNWDDSVVGRHLGRHADEFGIDLSSESSRNEYRRIAENVIDAPDYVAYNTWYGQKDDECSFFFKDDNVVIVNNERGEFVSLMKYEEGRNAKLTRIRNSVSE